ncbi:MAG: hypothetical protein QOG43_2203 [Actinomycetota bacterium]|jgi:hypothetical protein|nr:hypothetical protein [Actinomycetota bacterium]
MVIDRRRRVWLVAVAGWAMALLVATGCSDGRKAAAPSTPSSVTSTVGGQAGETSTPGEPSPAAEPSTTVASTTTLPGPLSREQACARFDAIMGDGAVTSDSQWSAALGTLAEQTADPELAAAIQRLADRYAASAASVSPLEVVSLCG